MLDINNNYDRQGDDLNSIKGKREYWSLLSSALDKFIMYREYK